MEQEKKGSIFGSVIIVLILLGLVIYYLSNKNKVSEDTSNITETQTTEPIQDDNITNDTSGVTSDAELQTQVDGLDTEFSDMNVDDLDI